MGQLAFKLPEIDREATRKRVEEALETCLLYEQIGFHPGHEAKVTPGYSETPPSNTNAFHSSTEDVAQKNVDTELHRQLHVKKVRLAVYRLGRKEREVIEKRYLTDPDMTDYETYHGLHMSERTYYRIKGRAFYKLAFALKLEVIKEPDQT
ncbi:ArpU family phage packaging/lysis transcriptional regulator [Effusibacillus consociatus]|uniref:ArpU family phage packaging/lysis transcriptional regulator n=1 Tax=Effusibacillus consociatus TaxID=1117041 RepID=A0ABV9Q5H7_9BACL